VRFKVFMDEAGTDGRSPYVMLGGYVAAEARWTVVDFRWLKALGDFGLSHYHLSDFWRGSGEFVGLSHDEKLTLVRRLFGIVDKDTLFGFTVRLDGADFGSHYRANAPRKPSPDSQFGLCFRSCLSFVPEYVVTLAAHDDVTVDFILEDGHRNIGDARRIFDQVKAEVPEIGRLLGSFATAGKRDFSGLQVADALVSSAIQMEEHVQRFIPYEPGADLETARASIDHSAPVFRAQVDKPVIDELLGGFLALKAMKHQLYLDRKQQHEAAVTRA
jgi:hypothetical protein